MCGGFGHPEAGHAPITAGLGLLAAWVLTRQRFAGRTALEFALMLTFAVPGTVIGVAYILTFNLPPLEITGTAMILIACFVFRNLPVGVRSGVAVARALVLEPDVLLFDEPLSNLDARLRRSMREEIRALQRRLGLTVVYVTHDRSEALAVSDKIVVMRNAGIAQAGTPEELYMEPDNVFVATFMGEANHVRGNIVSIEGEQAQVALDIARLALPHRGLPIGAVDVVIRPEAIRISADGTLPATVARATYMGAHTEYYFTTPVGLLFAIGADRTRRCAVGTMVGLSLDPAGVVVVRP